MFDDVRNFFVENVLQNYDEFVEEQLKATAGQSTDLRRAMNAAVSLSHLRERIPPPNQRKHDEIVGLCPDYALVRDIADAYKHENVGRKSAILVTSKSLSEQVVISEHKDAGGLFRIATKRIVATLSDGTTREVGEVFLNVLNFWIEELDRLGIISIQKRNPPVPRIPVRGNEDGAANLDLSMRKGERFRLGVVLKKSNDK